MDTKTQVMTVTPQAATKVVQLAEREGRSAACLRVRVLAGGCSGFSYHLSFEDGPAPDDHVIEEGGMRLLIDPASAPVVQGSSLEFHDVMLGGGLKVVNPNAVHECACGESFSV